MLCDQFARNSYEECDCEIHRRHPHKLLNILILDCWQREYDKRPYTNFQINKTFFEQRMNRVFNNYDWLVLINFIEKRKPKSVKIYNIEIPDYNKNVKLIERLVRVLEQAETVHLINVSISLDILLKFLKSITSSKIKNMDLSKNELTSEHLEILRCILIQSDVLESLDLENCSINENTFPILADGIYKSRSIRSIDISRPCPMSPISIFDSSKHMLLIAQLVWQNKLTILNLRQSNINGYDLAALTDYLASTNSKLMHLDLQSNNLTSHGTELLFKALSINKNLKELNLSANNLGSRGGLIIARLISYTNLESLDITHNQIGNEIICNLFCQIKKPCELRALRIYGNKFNNRAAVVLKRILTAGVLNQNNVDVTYTFDHSKGELCVVPYFKPGRMHT